MINKKHIDNKIKESFDKLHTSAPFGLWNNISKNIETPDNIINLDKQIKESFYKSNNIAPKHIWDGVNRQLYIYTTWKKIKRFLEIRTAIYKWSRIAALFLLLLLLGSIGYVFLSDLQIENISTVERNEIIENQLSSGNLNNKTINNENIEIINADKKEDIKQNIDESSNSEQFSNDFEVNYNKNNIIKNNDSYKTVLNNQLKTNISVIQKEGSIKQLSKEHIAIKDVQIISSDSTDEKLLPDINSIILPVFSSDTVSQKNNRFEIGITYSYNNTWLLNNNTRNSFVSTSLISTSATFSHNYGITANYNLSQTNALNSELYLNSETRQRYETYYEGKYYNKEIDLKYSKFTLLYQHNFIKNNYNNSPKSMVKAGFYVSQLVSMTKYVNNKIASVKKEYSNYDYGIKAAIGKEKEIDKMIIAYGINAEYGLKNIFTENKKIKKTFNKTKNSSIGIYLVFRYKL
ncbi:MAG: hypothetical protein L3J35_03860 [Bacteroidales bacterium]|nr:hypothetical protein [Bacteroidales bacterium]